MAGKLLLVALLFLAHSTSPAAGRKVRCRLSTATLARPATLSIRGIDCGESLTFPLAAKERKERKARPTQLMRHFEKELVSPHYSGTHCPPPSSDVTAHETVGAYPHDNVVAENVVRAMTGCMGG